MKKYIQIIVLIHLAFCLVACTPSTVLAPTSTIQPTKTNTIAPTETNTSVPTIIPTLNLEDCFTNPFPDGYETWIHSMLEIGNLDSRNTHVDIGYDPKILVNNEFVKAPISGTVQEIHDMGNEGWSFIIRGKNTDSRCLTNDYFDYSSGDIFVIIGHVGKPVVKNGDFVNAGDLIAPFYDIRIAFPKWKEPFIALVVGSSRSPLQFPPQYLNSTLPWNGICGSGPIDKPELYCKTYR